MSFGQAYQRWIVGGALIAVVLLAVGWFFLINPQNARTGSLRDQTTAAQGQVPSLNHRLNELRQQNVDKQKYLAQLESGRQALPTTSGLSDFLRELQAGGDSRGVAVTGVVVAGATKVTAAGGKYYALPITLSAEGTIDALGRFLDQLQQVQPRAVLINSADLSTVIDADAPSGTAKLTLTIDVFVSSTGTTTATPSTTPSTTTTK